MLAKKGESTHVMAYVTPSGSKGGGIHRISSADMTGTWLCRLFAPLVRGLAN